MAARPRSSPRAIGLIDIPAAAERVPVPTRHGSGFGVDLGVSRVSRTGHVACECPADERVRVPVPHPILRLQILHDGHVLLEVTACDDLLPLADRAPVLLLDGRDPLLGTLSVAARRPGR